MNTAVSRFLARLGRFTAVAGLVLAIPACGGPAASDSVLAGPSTTGGPASLPLPISVVTASRVVNTFPLLNGAFTLTLRATDGSAGTIKGSYTGQAVAPLPGNPSATLDFRMAASTGSGSSITRLEGTGGGAFVGEGDFTLSLSLTSPTAKSSDGSVVKVVLRGTSRISCSAANRILVTQRGTGSTPKVGDVVVDLQHEVGTTGCF